MTKPPHVVKHHTPGWNPVVTTDRIAEIRARLAAATPGPWEHVHKVTGLTYIALCGQSQDNEEHYVRGSGAVVDNGARYDAEFIAHAPADIAWLLEQLEYAASRVARIAGGTP